MQKRILSVQDISCLGKCANTVALPVLSALGHECVVLPTALLSAHTGIPGGSFLDLSGEMENILAHWQRLGLRFDAVLTGYFGSPGQMELVRSFLEGRELLRFVDPVLGDEGRLYSGYDGSLVAAMRRFCAGADVVTPNVTEAALLTGEPCGDDACGDAALERMLAGLFGLGVRRAVITGVRLGLDRIGIVGADRETGERLRLETPYAPVSLPGTGDVFASAFCGKLVAGTPFAAAAEAALSFTYRCIRRTLPTDIRYGLCFEEELKSL